MPDVPLPWQKVYAEVDARRIDLGLRWGELEDAADVSETTFRKMRASGTPLTNELKRRSLCRALKWPTNQLDRLLAGEPPVETATEAPEPPDALAEIHAALQAANAKAEALARRFGLMFRDEDGQIVAVEIDPPANVTPLRPARDPAPKTLGRAASGAKDSPPKPTGTKRQRPAPPEQEDY